MKRKVLRLVLLSLAWGLCLATVAASPAFAAGTLVLARGGESNSLDPGEAFTFEAIKVADWAFDGLVRIKGETADVEPALATSWTMSDDGLTWTFKLRKGVKFHDGTPFNADAVVFSLERQRDNKHPYYNDKFTRWDLKFSGIKQTRKVDDYTVQIVLKEKFPVLLANLAGYVGYIVSPTAVKANAKGFRNKPVGTGYFKFVKQVKDDYIEYVANKDYWDGAPKLDKLIVKVIPDNEVRLLSLKKGTVHVADGLDYTHFADIKKSPELKLYTAVSLGIAYMAMNTEKEGPMADPRVRHALQYAVNEDRIFKTVFYGYGEKAKQCVPSTWFGHNPSIPAYEFNPEKAKKLLAEAGYPNGFKVSILGFTDPRPYCPSPTDYVTLVKSDLEKIGIKVDIRMMLWNSYRAERVKGNFDLCLAGYTSGTQDTDALVYAMYHSSRKGLENIARVQNATVDKLLDAGRSIYERDKRTKIYQQLADEIHKISPWLMSVHPVTSIAARSEVKNIFVHGSTWVPLHKVSLD